MFSGSFPVLTVLAQNVPKTFLCSRCNNMDICHVPVHSDILPSVCPDTPKCLEAQYQCVSHSKVAEEVRQRRLPHLGGNISDVWSDRNVKLNDNLVKDAFETFRSV